MNEKNEKNTFKNILTNIKAQFKIERKNGFRFIATMIEALGFLGVGILLIVSGTIVNIATWPLIGAGSIFILIFLIRFVLVWQDKGSIRTESNKLVVEKATNKSDKAKRTLDTINKKVNK